MIVATYKTLTTPTVNPSLDLLYYNTNNLVVPLGRLVSHPSTI